MVPSKERSLRPAEVPSALVLLQPVSVGPGGLRLPCCLKEPDKLKQGRHKVNQHDSHILGARFLLVCVCGGVLWLFLPCSLRCLQM